MSNHQLTRSVAAAKQRIAHQNNNRRPVQYAQRQQMPRVPQGQGPVDVGACAPTYNQGGFIDPGNPWNADQEFWGLPNLAPAPYPGLLRSHLYRLGAVVQAAAGGGTRTIELAPPNGASLFVAGFLSRNDPFQIIINSIEQGSIGFSRVSEIDASVFNSDVCYCPAEIGCANNLTPLVIAFTPFGTPSELPYLNLTAVGTFDAGWGTCGVPYGYNSPIPQMPGSFTGGGIGYGPYAGGYQQGPVAGPQMPVG